MDHAAVNKLLVDAYRQRTAKRRNVRLPSKKKSSLAVMLNA
jgi:hypothetical protein